MKMHFICSACITENQDIEHYNAEKTKSSSIFMLLKASAEHKKVVSRQVLCLLFAPSVYLPQIVSLRAIHDSFFEVPFKAGTWPGLSS